MKKDRWVCPFWDLKLFLSYLFPIESCRQFWKHVAGVGLPSTGASSHRLATTTICRLHTENNAIVFRVLYAMVIHRGSHHGSIDGTNPGYGGDRHEGDCRSAISAMRSSRSLCPRFLSSPHRLNSIFHLHHRHPS